MAVIVNNGLSGDGFNIEPRSFRAKRPGADIDTGDAVQGNIEARQLQWRDGALERVTSRPGAALQGAEGKKPSGSR